MKRSKQLRTLLIICFVSIFQVTHAQTKEDAAEVDNLLDLSLEDLMNIRVESATKNSVSIQKAPSVVRVFTKNDFQTHGFNTLQDVLNAVPGIQVQEYRAGHQLPWIRGVQARYNNKILLLIDGEPMRDSYYGNFNIDEMIPLEKIEKIEVLNGPGSVLYGANSFAGVINISTKSEGSSARVAYGSFNTTEVFADYGKNGLYVSAKYLKSDGFEPELMSNGLKRNIDQSRELITGNIKYSKNDFSVNASITNYEYPYRYRSTDKNYRFKRTPITVGASFAPKLSDVSSLKISAYFNQFGFERDKTKYVDETSNVIKEHAINDLDTRMLGAELTYNLDLEKHSIVLGTSFQQDMATDMKEVIDFHIDGQDELGTFDVLTDPNISRSYVGVYAQDSYTINEIFMLTGGVRYDAISGYDGQFNYRLGLTGKRNNFYGKLLYGTAFRVPSYREYLDIDAPNPDLMPEHLNTLEFQVGYVNKALDVSLTLYNNSYNDFIQEIVVDSVNADGTFVEIDDEMAFNFDSRNITGVELDFKTEIKAKLRIHAGAHFFISKKEKLGELDPNVYTSEAIVEGENDLTFLSNTSGFVNLSYQLNSNLAFGLNNLISGSRSVPPNYQAGVPLPVMNKSNADGFVKMDFYARLSLMSSKKLVITAKVNNLLDNKIYSPPYGGSSGYDIEWPGLTFRAGIGYSF